MAVGYKKIHEMTLLLVLPRGAVNGSGADRTLLLKTRIPLLHSDVSFPDAGLVFGAERKEGRRRGEAERVGAAPALGAREAEAGPVPHVHVELPRHPLLLLPPTRVAVICVGENRIKSMDMSVQMQRLTTLVGIGTGESDWE
jgi:hypothetical protein